MKISKLIKDLETAKEEYGDRDLFMWVDSGEDITFLVKMPKFKFTELNGKEYDIKKEHWEKDLTQNVLAVTNLDSDSFNVDKDCVQYAIMEPEDEEN
jgi:hypothetical protein